MMGCPVCGSDTCDRAPHVAYTQSYPFMPGGRDPMAGQQVGRDFIYAPHAIYDESPGVERCIYGVGDPIPMVEAIKLGLAEKPKPKQRARRPKHDRMRRPAEDR